MCFLTKKIIWTNWHFGIFKVATICFGIIFGVYFADFWKPILGLLWIIFIVTGVWVTVIWLKAMKNPVS